MWIIPLLLLGAIVVAAASKSPRACAPTARQLPPSAGYAAPAGLPGPISMLGEILRIGQAPSPTVILCAIAEAQSIGRNDIASDIVRVFVAPVVHHHELSSGRRPHSCVLPTASRGRAETYERGSCALRGSPRAEATASVPMEASQEQRHATEEEILAMLHSDPKAFLAMASSRQPTIPVTPVVIDIPLPVEVAQLSPQSVAVPPPALVEQPLSLDQLLLQMPGYAGAGAVRVDPSSSDEAYEVRWLRGYPIPPLPPVIDGRSVRVAVVDALPIAQPRGLPSETVAQMEEAAGLPEAADQTREMAPGSPLAVVPDDAWRAFVMRLERESPTFTSSRHVGQYRQRRERLAALGIDPGAIQGSVAAQRAALDADLADAHHHAAAGGLFEHLSRTIMVPGHEGHTPITRSGLLGVIQCAGLDGAVGWLENPNDRKRYPHTTQAFLRTNGVF